MSLLKFEILNKTVELGSLTKASIALNITQSAVSHAISSLETEFGFSLLIRNRSGITLTSNGEMILKYIREIIYQNENLNQQVAAINGLDVGTINIGSFPSITVQWLPGIIKLFQTQYPSISINFYEGIYDEIETWINNGTVDFGFMTKSSAKSFEFIPLKNDNIVCILSENHPLHHLDTISFRQIKDEPLIIAKWGAADDVRKLFKRNHTVPNIKYEVAEGPAIIAMVQNGLGISLLPEMLVTLNSEHISIKNLTKPVFRTIGIALHSLRTASAASTKFIDFTKSWLRERDLLDY